MAAWTLFGSFVVLVLLRFPIPFALGLSTIITVIWRGSSTLMLVPQRMVTSIDSFALLAIPLFILVGEIMNSSGFGRKLVRFADALVGHFTGGLAHANVAASMFFGGISGSASADTAAIGSVLIPAMSESGYGKPFAVAVTIASSPIGTIIPPSIPMVIYGWLAGASIARLFAAGFIPGILVGFSLMALSYWISRVEGYGKAQPFDVRELWRSFVEALPALFMPLIVLGGIFGGVFTATEAGAVAVVYGLIMALIYRRPHVKDFPRLLVNTCKTTGSVMLLIALTSAFGWVMTAEGIPLQVTQFFLRFTPSPLLFLFSVIAISVIIGCFLTPTAALVILVPILYPVSRSFGIDPLHFGLVLISALATGHVTPPVGLCLYIGSTISGIPISGLVRPVLPFLAVMIGTSILLACFPELVLWVPRVLLP